MINLKTDCLQGAKGTFNFFYVVSNKVCILEINKKM